MVIVIGVKKSKCGYIAKALNSRKRFASFSHSKNEAITKLQSYLTKYGKLKNLSFQIL